MEGVEAFSWWLSFLLGWLKLFQGVTFFLVDWEFVLGVGEFRLTIFQQIIILLKYTKMHHLKRVSRECMPPRILSKYRNFIKYYIYSKRAIL